MPTESEGKRHAGQSEVGEAHKQARPTRRDYGRLVTWLAGRLQDLEELGPARIPR